MKVKQILSCVYVFSRTFRLVCPSGQRGPGQRSPRGLRSEKFQKICPSSVPFLS